MKLAARLATGGTIGADDFTDITDVRVSKVEWGTEGEILVTFVADLTAEQQAKVRRRIQSTSRTEEDLRAACETWLEPPLIKELVAVNMQVRRLTRLVLASKAPPSTGELPAAPTIRI